MTKRPVVIECLGHDMYGIILQSIEQAEEYAVDVAVHHGAKAEDVKAGLARSSSYTFGSYSVHVISATEPFV